MQGRSAQRPWLRQARRCRPEDMGRKERLLNRYAGLLTGFAPVEPTAAGKPGRKSTITAKTNKMLIRTHHACKRLAASGVPGDWGVASAFRPDDGYIAFWAAHGQRKGGGTLAPRPRGERDRVLASGPTLMGCSFELLEAVDLGLRLSGNLLELFGLLGLDLLQVFQGGLLLGVGAAVLRLGHPLLRFLDLRLHFLRPP